MKCEKCGHENSDVVEFCQSCNAPIPSQNSGMLGRDMSESATLSMSARTRVPRSRRAILAAFAVVVLMMASVSVYLVLINDSSDSDSSIHDPIAVMKDSAFTESNGVTSGSGTESDPFVIEGWTIELTDVTSTGSWGSGIYIGWTTAHFVIKNVTITKPYMNITNPDSSTGILVWGPSNGTIVGCNISNMNRGIEIKEAHNLTIMDNTISRCNYGIYADWDYERGGSRDVEVKDNNFVDNWRGCYVYGSRSFSILRNEFSGNSRCVVLHKVNDAVIQSNTISRDNVDAFWVTYCRNIDVQYNSAVVSGICIVLFSSNETLVRWNSICGGYICLFVADSGNVTVMENDFGVFDYFTIANIAVWMESSEYVTVIQNVFWHYHTGIISICCSSSLPVSNTYHEVENEMIAIEPD
jgi:parallel beta-helix repeat protein